MGCWVLSETNVRCVNVDNDIKSIQLTYFSNYKPLIKINNWRLIIIISASITSVTCKPSKIFLTRISRTNGLSKVFQTFCYIPVLLFLFDHRWNAELLYGFSTSLWGVIFEKYLIENNHIDATSEKEKATIACQSGDAIFPWRRSSVRLMTS